MQAFGSQTSILAMAFSSGIIVGGVLLVLIFCSVLTWAIILYKYRVFRRATRQSRDFLDL